MTVTLDFAQQGAVEATLFDPHLQEVRADPWPLLHELRAHDPVWHSPLGFFIITGYDQAVSVLRDHRFSVDPKNAVVLDNPNGGLPASQRGLDHVMLFVDPPDHTRLRALVSKAFTPRMVESIKPRINAIFDDLLAAVEDKDDFDLIAEVAYPFPVSVISELLGIPLSERDTFRGWAHDIGPLLDPLVPLDDIGPVANAGLGLYQYFDTLISERRAHPGSDLISELIHAEEEGAKLTPEELLATSILLLIAGHETTLNLLGNGMLALLRNPGQLDRLRSDPTLIKSAVEELLRHDGPATLTARIALEPVELGDKVIEKGRTALVMIAAANRDPAVFDDPDGLDISRHPNKHLAFSAGPHFCLGATLARAEGQIAIGRLIERFPRLALADEPVWRRTITFRGVESLRLSNI